METSVVDFETDKIESRPHYPPKPVGVAIRWPSGDKEYLAWGHPEGNNCDISTARMKLKDAYACDRTLFHHAAFDMDVSECYFGLKPKRFGDTLFLAFLQDPYAQELALKPLAEKQLKMAPEEQDDLRDWILANVKEAKRKKTKWGEYISQAPAGIVGKYAIGDVDRTYKLYKKLIPEIRERGMLDAYRRELACTPITLEMERSGVRVDRKGLVKCRDKFEEMDKDVMRAIAKRLRIDPKNLKSENNKKGFNINSGDQLGEALLKSGKLDAVIKTDGGKISTKIDNLKKTCNDKDLLNLLSVHSVTSKYLESFVRPWLEQAELTGGRILPKFNQVRGYGNDGHGGARTGRYSSSNPNMQNISSNVEESGNKEILQLMQGWLKDDYGFNFIGMRDFILPDENMVMICADFNQQELRILAHFEKGVLMRAYLENPMLDIHTFCQQLVKKAIGIEFPRKHIKITVFGIVYGMGVGKLAKRLEVDEATARAVKKGIMTAIPGIGELMRHLKNLANHDKPIKTWGGREYFCEEPKFDKKRKVWSSYEYRQLNYLVQSSAADCTKQGMINVKEQVPEARIAVQVHDELVCMIPSKKHGPRVVDAMCDMEFNVPMVAEAKYSEKSWARAAK